MQRLIPISMLKIQRFANTNQPIQNGLYFTPGRL